MARDGDGGRERPFASADAELYAVFPGDSEMAARCRAFDWAATPLGPVAGWSHSLRTTVGIVLTSRQPMFLWWSSALVQIYNDAYRPSLGTGGRADRALGARGKEFWTEIWDAIGPQIEQVMSGGEATWHVDQHLPIERNGRLEDVWWTYSYSPVRDDDGSIAATLVVCQETTGRVLADRARQAALEALAAEQARLREIVDLSPAFIAVLRGPEHRYERANIEYERLVGGRPLIGLTVAEALPEVVEQGFIRLLDRVLQTGEPYVGRAVPVRLIRASDGLLELRYVDFVYQALTEADGTRSGVFVHGVDVTVSVEGRREAEAARADAEEARERTARLQALTESLARARSLDDVARIVVADVVTALGARTGALSSRAADGDDALTLVRTVGFPDDVADLVRRQSLDQRTPLVECYLSGAPVWIESRDGPAGLDARYPSIAPVWEALGVKSAAFLPLVAAGEVVGVISFSFEGPHVFQPAERAFLLTLGQQAALAMERARLFGALASERERLRSLIRDMPAPVALHLGPEHRIAILSDAFRSIARGRDITGMTPREAYPEVIGQGIIEQFDEVFTTGRAWISPETHARFDRRGTGVEDTWFDIRYLPVRDADGQVVGVLNFSFDVTEQVRARHEVERLLAVSEASRTDAEAARAEAEAANRAKSEFLATMSHELRTPLNAIGGYAELIELGIHGPVSDAQRTALDRIQASQRHLLGLIAGVLDYSRVEAGAVSYRLVNVPVAEAVAEAEVLVSPQLRAKGLGYAWAGAPAELAVRADREKLQQILLNLLGNAVKFTNPRDATPGRIEVSCSTRGEGADARVCIHVRDTGEGIEPEKLEHVFEPFVQVDQRLTRPHAGVGLGLAISRDLARGMGGDLTAESELGTGSTFTLTLPRADA